MLKLSSLITLLSFAYSHSVLAAPAPMPLSPPPPTAGATVTDALRALGGKWRLVSIDGKPVARPNILNVWPPAFSFSAGCGVAAGKLRDVGNGRFAIERYARPSKCSSRKGPPPPFAGAELRASLIGRQNLMIEVKGRKWLFTKVDVTATVARDDFVRGAWLTGSHIAVTRRARNVRLPRLRY